MTTQTPVYISITEASQKSGKSIQTIRRMIKAKKVAFKREKTPQGFNYLIDEKSLSSSPAEASAGRSHRPVKPKKNQENGSGAAAYAGAGEAESAAQDPNPAFEDAQKFAAIVEKLISQNEQDKENFFKLLTAFQDRIQLLEKQIALLEAPKKRWYQFWKSAPVS